MIIKGPLTFDDYLEKRLFMGTYQTTQIMVALLINFLDGIEWAFLSIVISIIAKEWNLDQTQISFLGSSFFIGVFAGNLFCIFYADSLGRQRTLSILMIISFFIALLMYFSQSFHQFFVLRVFYGFIYGGTIPSCFVLISEIVLQNSRGVTNTSLNLAMSFGKIYLCLLCFVFLEDFESGNWRGLLLINLLPLAICGLSTVFFLNESPRYYMIHQKFQDGFELIDKIGKYNSQDYLSIQEEEKSNLQEWAIQVYNQENTKKELRFILGKEYFGFTWRLWIFQMLINVGGTTVFILMPFLYQQKNYGFKETLITYCADAFIYIIMLFIIDLNKGRHFLLIGGNIIIAIVFFLLPILGENILLVGFVLIQNTINMIYQAGVIISCESYSTLYRSMGVASAIFIGKLTAAICPFIIFPLYFISPYYPFWFCLAISLISLYAAITYPFGRSHEQLDLFLNNQSYND